MLHPYSSPSSQAFRPLAGPSFTVESVEHVNDRDPRSFSVDGYNTCPCENLSSCFLVDVLYRLDCERLNATQRLQASDSRFAEGPGVGGADVLRCIETFVETNHKGALPCSAQKNEASGGGFYSGTFPKTISLPSLDSTVNQVVTEEMYFTKEEHTMADHSHPMDGAILDFAVTRMRLIELFRRDGGICEDEQMTLDLFDDAKRTVRKLHAVDQAAETYKKQLHSGVTRYGQRKWNLAGLEVEPYEPEGAA